MGRNVLVGTYCGAWRWKKKKKEKKKKRKKKKRRKAIFMEGVILMSVFWGNAPSTGTFRALQTSTAPRRRQLRYGGSSPCSKHSLPPLPGDEGADEHEIHGTKSMATRPAASQPSPRSLPSRRAFVCRWHIPAVPTGLVFFLFVCSSPGFCSLGAAQHPQELAQQAVTSSQQNNLWLQIWVFPL